MGKSILPEITLAQSNVLTNARYNFTKIEKRAVYFILAEVRKQFIENEGQRDLFSDLVVTLKTETLKRGISDLKEVYKALRSLRQKSIWIEDENRVLEIGYINYFEHEKKSESLEVQVSKKLLPYLVELAEQYTTYSLTVAIGLTSQYSQRFYEYCSQFKTTGFLYLTIDDLRYQMMIENKYERYALLKSRVIDVAQKELEKTFKDNESELYFVYKEDRIGRTVKGLKIKIITKKDADRKVLSQTDMIFHLRNWLNAWFMTAKKPKNKTWVDNVIKEIQLNSEKIELLYKRLEKMQEKEEARTFPAYARYIIEEDFLS